MAKVILTQRAVEGMDKCRAFLNAQSSLSSARAAEVIRSAFALLSRNPLVGRPVENNWRELVIPYGSSGYVALYNYIEAENVVYILAFRHQREAGY